MFLEKSVVSLIYQVSDKRPLERCGDEECYLNETGYVPIRPPGLRIRRAEVLNEGVKS